MECRLLGTGTPGGLSASPVANGYVSSTAEAGAGSRQHPPHPHFQLSQVYQGPKPAGVPQQGRQQQGQQQGQPQGQQQPQQTPAGTAAVLAGGDGLWDMAAELRHQKQQAKQHKQQQAQQQT
jgi:hypothetical protein